MQSSLYTPQAATFFLSSKSLERKSSIFYIPEGSFSHVSKQPSLLLCNLFHFFKNGHFCKKQLSLFLRQSRITERPVSKMADLIVLILYTCKLPLLASSTCLKKILFKSEPNRAVELQKDLCHKWQTWLFFLVYMQITPFDLVNMFEKLNSDQKRSQQGLYVRTWKNKNRTSLCKRNRV